MAEPTLLSMAGKFPLQVLIVEDNTLERFILGQWLRHHGYKVVEAVTADEALILLESSLPVDAVVTDIRMPGKLNGLDLARILKTKHPHIGVIAVSSEDFQDQLKPAGCTFFRKPYDLELISSQIAQYFKNSALNADGREEAAAS